MPAQFFQRTQTGNKCWEYTGNTVCNQGGKFDTKLLKTQHKAKLFDQFLTALFASWYLFYKWLQ